MNLHLDKTLEQVDQEALEAWDDIGLQVMRGLRALLIGGASIILASHQPYLPASPLALGIAAGLLSFVNMTKVIAFMIVAVLALLALTPPPVASWLVALVTKQV